ncbi:MAG TPA: ATP-binding protein [Ktedonobacterales bacterium]
MRNDLLVDLLRRAARASPTFVRRSLLIQLVSVYLLFVTVVLIAGVAVNAVVEQRLRAEVEAADQALAQEIALDTGAKLIGAEDSVRKIGQMALSAPSDDAKARAFDAFMAASSDIDHVYWLDTFGAIVVSERAPNMPPDTVGIGAEFSPPGVVQRITDEIKHKPGSTAPVIEVGIAVETTLQPGVIIAEPVYAADGRPAGIVAIDLSLGELSTPLVKVAQSQQRKLSISVVDDHGDLIATDYPDPSRYLISMRGALPGLDQALAGGTASQVGSGLGGQDWLYTAVPISGAGWAVVVQRPVSEALAAVAQFHVWLLAAALIFAVGGFVFWLLLVDRVIRPLHALAVQHQAFPAQASSMQRPRHAAGLARREDEVGGLARSVERLERDVLAQFGELRTLLDTSNAVVQSLDPRAVGETIIREVRRLVDVQAAAVLVPDEHGTLRALISAGRVASYNQAVRIQPDDPELPSARALREGQPVQMIVGEDADTPFPPLSYAEGFRAVLAIPIVSPHAGAVVLVVHRVQPQRFSDHEVDLLLTFANYAALAWEHAVLYERSDERLRDVAQENERLYRQAVEEKQTLSAIMGSMSDGLVLTGPNDHVLYANRGASAITGLPVEQIEGSHISTVHTALMAAAERPEQYEQGRRRAERREAASWLLEMRDDRQSLAIELRTFDVRDDDGQVIGRGLLLRDVTQQREMDRFKSTLLAAVGHELRTPLTAIRGHASTLLQEDVSWTPQDQQRSLRAISDEAARLAQLVTSLLDLSRLEAGLLALRRAPWLLEDLITGAVGRLSEHMAPPEVELADDLPPLDVDAARVEVVLHNLIANAATYGAGAVRVTARRQEQEDAVLVEVADNGPGISAADLPHIFERFYRAPRDQRQHSTGTGLGLAISKAFVEAHGGRIWAQSGPQGTTVAFTLPVSITATRDASGSLDDPGSSHGHRRAQVTGESQTAPASPREGVA